MKNIDDIKKHIKNSYGLKIEPNSDLDKILQLFYIRNVEIFISKIYSEFLFRCPVHLSIGQEAVAVGVSANLLSQDKVISTHRSHAHYLAKGGNLESMFAEMMGKPNGCSKGRGGSMHLFDKAKGFYGSIPIVGSSLSIAAGLGYAQKFSQSREITVSFLGDATFETGQFHESLNFISTFKIPLLIIFENNKYSTYSPIGERQSKSRNLKKIINGYGIEYTRAIGDDVFEVYNLAKELTASVRDGIMQFIEFDTFRRFEHCGPNIDDQLGYRSKAEISTYNLRDPINVVKEKYIDVGKMSEAIQIFELFLPKYVDNVYQIIKHSNAEHPLLDEKDCYAKK